jgi:hypothetical protein
MRPPNQLELAPTRHPGRFALTVAVTTLVALGIALVPIVLVTRDGDTPSPSPGTPGIGVVATDLRIVPEVSVEKRKAYAAALKTVLHGLYTGAFTAEAATDVPSPSPASSELDPFLTVAAQKAVRANPEVFSAGEDLTVTQGRVEFAGVVTLDGSRGIAALVTVDFTGTASPVGESSPTARIRQTGTIELTRAGDGAWLVSGFDVKLTSEPAPTPTPGS